MHEICCEECGKEFLAKRRTRRFCDDCNLIRSRQRAREHDAAHGPRRASSVPLTCETCGQTWFSRSNRGRWCGDCRRNRAKRQIAEWQRQNRGPEGGFASIEERQAYQRKWMLARYGLTPGEWDEMAAAQGGRCAICLTVPPKLVTDHCHKTGGVRGLLCSPCNRAIGHLGDNAAGVARAVAYLERFENE